MLDIMNIAKTVYGGWNLKSTEELNPEQFSSAKVTQGDYGLSVCFFLKTGQMAFIPLSKDSALNEGDTPEIKNLRIQTLSKPSEGDIYRVIEVQ